MAEPIRPFLTSLTNFATGPKGLAVLLLEHSGRGPNARGTSAREVVLDAVAWLRQPDDYEPTEGARFEVHITKGRSLWGEEAEPFEARLEVRGGEAIWTMASIEDRQADVARDMWEAGSSVSQIAADLGLTARAVQLRLKKAGVVLQRGPQKGSTTH